MPARHLPQSTVVMCPHRGVAAVDDVPPDRGAGPNALASGPVRLPGGLTHRPVLFFHGGWQDRGGSVGAVRDRTLAAHVDQLARGGFAGLIERVRCAAERTVVYDIRSKWVTRTSGLLCDDLNLDWLAITTRIVRRTCGIS